MFFLGQIDCNKEKKILIIIWVFSHSLPVVKNVWKSPCYHIFTFIFTHTYIHTHTITLITLFITLITLITYIHTHINYIILYHKTYAKIRDKSYNNYKCHHRNKTSNLPIKKLLTYLLNCNKRIEKNIRDNDSSGGTKQLLK